MPSFSCTAPGAAPDVTLTGDGERAYLRRPDISLQTHIDDVLALVEAEVLYDLVLVGHSYGGMVITGAAAALRSREPRRVHSLVYVDAMVPPPGQGWGDAHAPEIVAARRAAAAAHVNALPPPDPATGFALSAADADWLRRRHVPHPFGIYRVPLHYDGTLIEALPRLFIDGHQPAGPTIDAMHQRVRELPGWQLVEMATGHIPMVTQPELLARHLLAFAAG